MLLLKSHVISQDVCMFILFAVLYATGLIPKLVSVYYTCMHMCVYMYNDMIFYCCHVTEITVISLTPDQLNYMPFMYHAAAC